MDWELILTVIGTVATVISTIVAVAAKNGAKKILNQVKEEKSRTVTNSGEVEVINKGINSGAMSGINTGEIHL